MAAHRSGSSRLSTKLRQKNLRILDEGDRLLSEINQNLLAYKAGSNDHPSVDVSNLREATIELGSLIAWASELIAAQSLVSYRSSIQRDMADVEQKHAIVGSAPGRDRSLDDAVKAFVERVGTLNASLGVVEWD